MTSILVDIARNNIPFTLSVENRNVSEINGLLVLSNHKPKQFLFDGFYIKDNIFVFYQLIPAIRHDLPRERYLPNQYKIIENFSGSVYHPLYRYYAIVSNTNPIFVDLYYESEGMIYSIGPSDGYIKLLPEDDSIGFVLTPVY